MSAVAALILSALGATGNADFTFIVDLDEGRLRIQEVWTLRLEEPAAGGQVSLPLPPGARNVVQPEDQTGFAHDASGGRVVNRSGLPAGETQIFFNYDLPYATRDLTIRRSAPSPSVLGMRIAVPVIEGLTVRTPRSGQRSPREVGGVPFELIDVLRPFEDSNQLTIDLVGLPVRTAWPRWAAVAASVALVLATLALLASRARTRGAAIPRPELKARKERLLQALQLLDRERGAMDEKAYGSRRNELLGELAEVLRQEAR